MARLRYDSVYKADLGTTEGTEENVGNLTTNPEASDLVFLMTNYVNQGTRTAAEGTDGKFIWKLGSLAFDDFKFMRGEAEGGAPATNIESYVSYPKAVPFASQNPNVGNKKISVNYDAIGDGTTSEVSALASIVYAEGNVPADVLGNVGQLKTRVRWNDTDNQTIDNVVSQQFSSALNIPNWVNELVAIGVTITLDEAPVAGGDFLAYLDFSSGGSLPNLTPTRIPIPALNASLGTPVGGSVICREHILPYYAKLPNADVTVKPTINVLTAYNGEINVSYTLYGR